MKKIFSGIYYGSVMLLLVFSSCLKAGLEELPAFEEAEITDVKFDFRYKDMADINPLDGEPIVKVVNLIVKNKTIDKENATVTCTLEVPKSNTSFTDAIRNTVSLNSIVGKFNVSTAAIVQAGVGSPVLGTPGDWSKGNKYIIKAANGFTKEWTVTVTTLEK